MKNDHLEIILEDIRSKFDIVIEGHASLDAKMDTMQRELAEKIDRVDFKVDVVNKRVDALDKKLDAVAADLTAHRADTEAHHGIYREGKWGVNHLR